MNVNLRKFILLFTACLFACPFARAAEQDNWYIAWEASVDGCQGVAYHVDSTTGVGQIYVTSTSSDDVKVYDLNGSLDRTITIASSRNNPFDLVLDEEGPIYIAEYYAVTCLENDGTFKWRTGKNASETNSGSSGSGDGEFNNAKGITIGQDGNLYVADYHNHRVQVLDKNGTFIRKFGEYGSAPGQLSNPTDVVSLPDGRIVVVHYLNNDLHHFLADGTFLKRGGSTGNATDGKYVTVGQDGTMFFRGRLFDSEGEQISYIGGIGTYARTCFTPEGDLIESYSNKLQLWKRAFRTKGLPERNVIAQPAIREVSQRAGTNIIDIDVEIIDADDDNATLGILAAIDGEFNNPNKWIIPQGWVDYSENQIGSPISTNVVHTFSWDVKQDWAEQTGSLEFEVFSQTGSRTKPIDVHYLTLPLGDGNLTISRSPIKDAEMVNYLKYLLVSGQGGLSLSAGKIVDGNGVALVEVSGSSLQATAEGRALFMDALGHRWAKLLEVTMAREAATPGTINQWEANRQIEPRDLPNQVNEYGFDVGSHGSRAWWVVKNSTLPRRDFNSTIFDNNGSENEYFGSVVAAGGPFIAAKAGDRKINLYKDPMVPRETWFKVSGGQTTAPFYQVSGFYVEEEISEANEWSEDVYGLSIDYNISHVGAGSLTNIDAFPQPGPNMFTFTVEANPGWRFVGFGFFEPDGSYTDSGGEFSYESDSSSIAFTANFEPIGDQGNAVDLSTYEFLPGHTYHFIDYGVSASHPFMIGEEYGDMDFVSVQGGPLNGTLGDVLTLSVPHDFDGNLSVFCTNHSNMEQELTVGEPAPNSTNDLSLNYVVQPADSGSSSSNGFGSSFDFDSSHVGDLLAVGAPEAWNKGQVYLYRLGEDSAEELARITASDGTSYDRFGSSVAMNVLGRANNSRLLVVGAYTDDPNGNQDAGSAYVFRRESNGTITELAKLTAPDGRAHDYFGSAVAVGGNHIAIGAYWADAERDGSSQGDAGKVYLYKVGQDGNVSYVETLTASYAHGGARFGYSLSISEGFLAVGQNRNGYDQNGHNGLGQKGSVCLYQLSDAQPARLTSFIQSPVPVSDGYFGYSVDLEGNRLVVGAKQEDAEAANDTGAAYLFEISEDGKPSLVERFTHPAGKASDQFGVSVGVSGRNIVVGADFFDLPNERWNAGQAIFYRETE
ncbi:hypothetical protein OAP38_04865 [Opitutales bacterium]|nr:hypothetical protein [Opitutales bacterium]